MDWTAVIIAALTGGGLVKLLDVIANRKIIESKAEEATARAADMLLKNSEVRIERLTQKVKDQDGLISALQAELLSLKRDITNRESEIMELQKLKVEQAEQIDNLLKDVTERDKRISNLEKQVIRLLARIDELEGRSG